MVGRPGLLSDRGELEALFDELAAELGRLGVAAELVMVGGAWLLWHTQRVATRDVDSARRLDPQLTDAIDAVGQRHDLRSGWLNDAAAAFWPAGASFEDSAVVYEQEHLVVRAPAPEVVFLMKLYRADPQDREDMVLLWAHVRLCRSRGSRGGVRGRVSPCPRGRAPRRVRARDRAGRLHRVSSAL